VLTELTARMLPPVVRAIKDWSETHIAQIHGARTAYDRAARP
jgi:DNA-binding HxlR family transcriptional regulator